MVTLVNRSRGEIDWYWDVLKLKDSSEMCHQEILNFFLVVVPFVLSIAEPFNFVSSPSTKGGSMKVPSIAITFLDSFISRLLLPESFFTFLKLIYLVSSCVMVV